MFSGNKNRSFIDLCNYIESMIDFNRGDASALL